MLSKCTYNNTKIKNFANLTFHILCLQELSDSSLDGLMRVLPEGASQGFPQGALPQGATMPVASAVQPDATIMAASAQRGIDWSQLISSNSVLQGPDARDNNILGCRVMDFPSRQAPPICQDHQLAGQVHNSSGAVVPMPMGLNTLMHGHIFTPPTTQAAMLYATPPHGMPTGWSRGQHLASMNRIQALNDPEYLKMVGICSAMHFEQQLDLSNRLKNLYYAKMRELKQFSTQ